MRTRRYKKRLMKNRTIARKHKGKKGGRRWITAIDAAQQTLSKTGSYSDAKSTLQRQALKNARKIFKKL